VPTIAKIALTSAVLLLAVACSASPSTQTATPVGQTPGTPTQPIPTAGATQPPAGGSECSGFPTMNPASPALPSFITDPGIEAKFPSQIDGQPVTDVESFSWAQLVCLGGQAAIDRIRGTTQFDLLSLSMATATATVEGDEVELMAFRTPGGDATQIVQTLAELSSAAGEESDIASITPGTAGGKSVLVVAGTDGTTSYGYVSGDTLVIAEDITQSQADKIFAAFG
jgi:hypothetical protein